MEEQDNYAFTVYDVSKLISSTANRPFIYEEACKLAKSLSIHANGEVPESLIRERRPSERESTFEYRKKIFKSKTEIAISKVISTLCKIHRSQDWIIQYNNNATPPQIAEGESLESYCEKKYPKHTSVTNWVFTELLRQYLIDANGIVGVIPMSVNVAENEYMKPTAKFFNMSNVLAVAEDYCLVKSDEVFTYYASNQRAYIGAVYYMFTRNYIARYKQSTNQNLVEEWVYRHNLNYMPITLTSGIFFKSINGQTLYKSRIASMVTSLDEAAREYSDLQAEVVQHIHSEKMVLTNTECVTCKGSGQIFEKNKKITCPKCHGTGYNSTPGPYGEYQISTAKAGEAAIPMPFVSYVQKDTRIVELQDKRVRDHIYDALSSINMQFLDSTPLSQSGLAKEVDKDELNNFVNSVAEDIVRIMDDVYLFICNMRYGVAIPDEEVRRNMLPNISVPERFDILSPEYLINEITKTRAAGVSPLIIAALEVELANKKFVANPEIGKKMLLAAELDPISGVSEDDKMTRLANGGVTELDYIISSNITFFVNRAFNEEKDFFSSSYPEKRKIIEKYAEEIITKNSAVKNVVNTLGDGTGS